LTSDERRELSELRRENCSTPCGRGRVTPSDAHGRPRGPPQKVVAQDHGARPRRGAGQGLDPTPLWPLRRAHRRYVGDITYINTWEGWVYLATVIDLASRRVIGWALADHMRTELVSEALEMAFVHRQPASGVIFHSDRGCQGSTPAPTTPPSPAPTASYCRSGAPASAGTTRWRRASSPPSNAS
jgi:transposase InsO family protein